MVRKLFSQGSICKCWNCFQFWVWINLRGIAQLLLFLLLSVRKKGRTSTLLLMCRCMWRYASIGLGCQSQSLIPPFWPREFAEGINLPFPSRNAQVSSVWPENKLSFCTYSKQLPTKIWAFGNDSLSKTFKCACKRSDLCMQSISLQRFLWRTLWAVH